VTLGRAGFLDVEDGFAVGALLADRAAFGGVERGDDLRLDCAGELRRAEGGTERRRVDVRADGEFRPFAVVEVAHPPGGSALVREIRRHRHRRPAAGERGSLADSGRHPDTVHVDCVVDGECAGTGADGGGFCTARSLSTTVVVSLTPPNRLSIPETDG
jgi:hypothetical protein